MKKKKLILLLIVAVMLFGCTNKASVKKEIFITTEDGKKQYKNDDGILIKNDWVEINGDKYFFDLNGYLVTDGWVQNEYFVDKDGKMKTDYWYNDEENPETFYYLGNDGKYVRDDVVEIGKKKYAFDKSGNWVKNNTYFLEKEKEYVVADANGIVIEDEGLHEINGKEYYVKNDGYLIVDGWKNVDKKNAYFGEDGKRIYNGFAILETIKSTDSEIKKWSYIDEQGDILKNDYVKVEGLYYCANKDGVLKANEWDEYEGKKYYYGKDCYMLTNQWIDNVYYVNENGEMVTNKEMSIGGKTYVFGDDGKGNVKVVKKTYNEYWEIKRYTNTAEQYVINKIGFVGEKEKIYIIADKDDFRMRMYWKSSGNLIKKTEDYVRIIVTSNGNEIITLENIIWDKDGYFVFNNSQKSKMLNIMKNDNNMIGIGIIEYNTDNSTKYTYMVIFDSRGFNEIYSSLD